MQQGSVRNIDISTFVGLSISKIEISEFGICLDFKHNKKIEITTHWELFDIEAGAVIDRAMSLKFREKLLLLKLIHRRLLSFTKIHHQVDFVFEGDLRLTVS